MANLFTECAEPNVAAPLSSLSYWTQWGDPSVVDLLDYGFRHFVGHDLTGQTILDLGCGAGRMSVLFALLKANVWGIELDRQVLATKRQINFFERAHHEVEKWGVATQVQLMTFDGNLDALPDGAFDLIFTKSVLALIPHLESFLQKLSRKLKHGGKVIFVENGYHSHFQVLGRRLVHAFRRQYDWRTPVYLNDHRSDIICRAFDVTICRKAASPHWVLFCGHKRGESTSVEQSSRLITASVSSHVPHSESHPYTAPLL